MRRPIVCAIRASRPECNEPGVFGDVWDEDRVRAFRVGMAVACSCDTTRGAADRHDGNGKGCACRWIGRHFRMSAQLGAPFLRRLVCPRPGYSPGYRSRTVSDSPVSDIRIPRAPRSHEMLCPTVTPITMASGWSRRPMRHCTDVTAPRDRSATEPGAAGSGSACAHRPVHGLDPMKPPSHDIRVKQSRYSWCADRLPDVEVSASIAHTPGTGGTVVHSHRDRPAVPRSRTRSS